MEKVRPFWLRVCGAAMFVGLPLFGAGFVVSGVAGTELGLALTLMLWGIGFMLAGQSFAWLMRNFGAE